MKTVAVLLAFLLLPCFSPAQSAKSSSGAKKRDECKISGMVVKLAGSEPLKNARVRLQSQDDRRESHSVVTDAGGRFELKGVDPGRYRLVVHRDSFVTQAYGQKKPDDPGAILTLRAGQEVKDLLFRLIPSAVIAGRVINEDGDPLPWVQVSALREAYAGGKKSLFSETTVPTNDLGEYRLFGLPPGRYFIRADYKTKERMTGRDRVQWRDDEEPRGYIPMYYPSSTEPARAITVAVKAGEEIPALEVLMRRVEVFTVRGRIYNLVPRRSNPSYTVTLLPRNSEAWLSLPQRDAIVDEQDGTFIIRDVLPGAYALAALWFDEGKRYQANQNIDVRGADVEGVALTVVPGIALNGRLIWEGQPILERNTLAVYLRAADSVYGYGARATLTAPGTFVLNDVYDLTYRVTVGGLCDDCYLKALRYSGSSSPEDTFTPARGSNATLELTISSRGARVQGSVADADNLPAVGVWVTLVPDPAHRSSRRFYRSASTDQYGRFELRGIAPGEYKLFSWEEAEYGAWEDPEFLRPFEEQGEKISFEEGDQKTLNITAIRKSAEPVKP
jgi:hypothetical protein